MRSIFQTAKIRNDEELVSPELEAIYPHYDEETRPIPGIA
jgi:hypothetical protein